MQTELLKLIEDFDVISFDVFDTLLLRPFLSQEDLWRERRGKSRSRESLILTS